MSHISKLITTAVISSALLLIGGAYAATPKLISGIPFTTFCSTYAKDVATKSVAIGLIVKIKDNPSQKAKLMRQYQSFVALGKQYCKDTTYVPASTGTVIDISRNKPIIVTTTNSFTTDADYFTGYDESELDSLTITQKEITLERIERAKAIYAAIVKDFISKGWLTTKDKDEMVGKIGFKLSHNCNELDGKILVRQWFDQDRKPLKNELINLFITINLCFQPGYQAGYDSFLQRIIYHELGHYLNYFHDEDDLGFKNLCRWGETSTCSEIDFVNSYAETEPDEDYAETFSYYVQGNNSPSSSVLQQKMRYFERKFPQ